MNKKHILVIALIFISVFPAHAERYSSGGEAFFVGALQGLFIMFVIWIWRVIKNGRNKNEAHTDENIKTPINKLNAQSPENQYPNEKISTPWEIFQKNNASLSRTIQILSEDDLNNLTEKELDERIATLLYMSEKFKCSLSSLKQHCIEIFTSQFSPYEIPAVIEELSSKAKEESLEKSVTIKNTMNYILCSWLKKYNDHFNY